MKDKECREEIKHIKQINAYFEQCQRLNTTKIFDVKKTLELLFDYLGIEVVTTPEKTEIIKKNKKKNICQR